MKYLLAVFLIGCGSRNVPSRGDGGTASGEPQDSRDASVVEGEGDEEGEGDDEDEELEGRTVLVQWIDPPSEYRNSPGLTPCGTALRPSIDVHTLGGMRDSVVLFPGQDSVEVAPLSIANCLFQHRVIVTGPPPTSVAVVSHDERDYEVISQDVTHYLAYPGAEARLEFAVAGQYPVALGDDIAYVVVPPPDYVGRLVSEKGRVQVSSVDSRVDVTVWHPAVGGRQLLWSGPVELAPKGPHVVDFAP